MNTNVEYGKLKNQGVIVGAMSELVWSGQENPEI
jgi:hypothetical protein